jgi:hypothetical protein
MEGFNRDDLSEIPVVDSSVENIPEGLVLLPAPRPISRWRTTALAVTACLMGAGAILIAVLGPETSPLTGEPGPSGPGQAQATLASASDTPDEAQSEDAEPTERKANTNAPADAPAAGPAAQTDRHPASPSSEPSQPLGGEPSGAPHVTQAASNGQSSETDEEASTASDPPNQPANPPAGDGGQPELVLPDASETIREVGDVVDEVTDSLPIPDLIGD